MAILTLEDPEGMIDMLVFPRSYKECGHLLVKDAILFFNELLPLVPEHDRAVVILLINEEKQHIVYLDQLKKKFQKRE